MRSWAIFRKRPPTNYPELYSPKGDKYYITPWPQEWVDINVSLFAERSSGYKLKDRIGNIRVFINHPQPGIWFLSELWVAKQFRGREIATTLLDYVISKAAASNAIYIIGWATPMADYESDFDLYRWYARRGFEHARLERARGILHNIVLKLR